MQDYYGDRRVPDYGLHGVLGVLLCGINGKRDLVVQLTRKAPAPVAHTILQPILDEPRLTTQTCTHASLKNEKANSKGKVRTECVVAIHFMRNTAREKVIDACLQHPSLRQHQVGGNARIRAASPRGPNTVEAAFPPNQAALLCRQAGREDSEVHAIEAVQQPQHLRPHPPWPTAVGAWTAGILARSPATLAPATTWHPAEAMHPNPATRFLARAMPRQLVAPSLALCGQRGGGPIVGRRPPSSYTLSTWPQTAVHKGCCTPLPWKPRASLPSTPTGVLLRPGTRRYWAGAALALGTPGNACRGARASIHIIPRKSGPQKH